MVERESGENRSLLLDCALRLFVAYGYDGVGVQRIVEEAGITKPTLYHYFGSKLGLLQTLLGERFEEFYRQFRMAADYRHDLPLTLKEMARVSFAFARSQPELYRLHLSLWFAPISSDAYRAVAQMHEKQYAIVETVFREAARDHGNMRGRHRAYAATFLGMLNNYISLALNGRVELNDALLYQSVHQFMHGIFS
jgi:TetR/AcrR family transcriptional regulator